MPLIPIFLLLLVKFLLVFCCAASSWWKSSSSVSHNWLTRQSGKSVWPAWTTLLEACRNRNKRFSILCPVSYSRRLHSKRSCELQCFSFYFIFQILLSVSFLFGCIQEVQLYLKRNPYMCCRGIILAFMTLKGVTSILLRNWAIRDFFFLPLK